MSYGKEFTRYERIAEEFEIVHKLGLDQKPYDLKSALLNVDALLDEVASELSLARCRNDEDCVDPKGCVERMREGIDKVIVKLKDRKRRY